MSYEPPSIKRSVGSMSEDEKPTLILPRASLKEPDQSSPADGLIKRESHNGDQVHVSTPAPESRISRLKKFFTSTPSRRVASIFGAVALAVISGAVGAAPTLFNHAPKAQSSTQHIFFLPWSEAGGLSSGLRVSSSVRGYCWTNSQVSSRPDAYRCFGPNAFIYDPCFADDSQKSVACPIPSPADVTVIRLTKPLPEVNPTPWDIKTGPASAVWLAVLANGDSCYAAYVMADSPGGMSLSYSCRKGNLYGDMNRDGATWTIWEQKEGVADMTLAPVVQAYS